LWDDRKHLGNLRENVKCKWLLISNRRRRNIMKKLPVILALSLITVLTLSLASQAQDPKADLRLEPAAVNFVTINPALGNPLKIHVGEENSFQIFNAAVPGNGQIYPTVLNSPADMGVFVRIPTGSGTLYAPNFSNHGGTATGNLGSYTPWTPVSLSPVTGTGTSLDPYTVTVVSDAGASLRMTMTVRYVNGENFFRHYCMFTNISGGLICFDHFVGSDIYLAGSDFGVPYLIASSGSVGGQDCPNQDYTILHIPLSPRPADAYTARFYGSVWQEIGAGHLTNTIEPATCTPPTPNGIDDGAALEWQNICLQPDDSVTIQSATSFGDIPPIAVPSLTEWGLIIFGVVLLGFITWVFLKKRKVIGVR
jgi:hypothetical protein